MTVEKEAKNNGQTEASFYRDRGEGRGPRIAMVKPNRMRTIDQAGAESRLQSSAVSKVPNSFPNSSSPTKHRKTKLAVMGLSAAILDQGDPRYAQCVRLANAYRKVRAREMYISHGFVSSGVSALLAASAMALASSRFLYETAASVEGPAKADILRKASQLSDSARQNDLTAWELCSREAVIKKRNESNNLAVPWLSGAVEDPSGQVKRPRGRPRKAAVVVSEEENPCLTENPASPEPSVT